MKVTQGSGERPGRLTLLFRFVPLFSRPAIVRQSRVLVTGETCTISSGGGTIECDGKLADRSSDVASVRIRTSRGGEGGREHRLSTPLKDGRKLRIRHSADADEVASVAEDIADVLGVSVPREE